MEIGLFTDAPKHNLALMKISTYHKQLKDSITLNFRVADYDLTYGSWLFREKMKCDLTGGPASVNNRLPSKIDACRPDYSLYPDIEYSLGFTWDYCPRKCAFCVVPKMKLEKKHKSIWDFHEARFKKICLLNNNTFSDPQWKETFEEIWDAKLVVHDENGYDLRLLNEEKAEALKKTKFEKQIHFAWDSMKDEKQIINGLKIAKEFKLNGMLYVLMGFDTNFEEDIYRCQKIHDLGFDPFPMLYNPTPLLRAFRRMIYLRYYRKYKPTEENKGETFKEAWKDYKKL